MNTEIQLIIRRIENVNSGEPWFGRAIYILLEEVDAQNVYSRPMNSGHSMAELLYHMITWADFTMKRIEKDPVNDIAGAEELDWPAIDPKIHTWKKGIAKLKAIHRKIITLLRKKNDSFLEEKVDFRAYNFRFLINGMIEHNIYHAGQIAYIAKLFQKTY